MYVAGSSASSSSLTTTTGLNDDDVSENRVNEVCYPRPCDICQPKVICSDRFEFSRHLRNNHSVKEGGSYICRYGLNGICQTLPLEGVSDNDYEAHLRKCHVNTALPFAAHLPSSSSRNELVASGKKCFTLQSFTQNLASVLSDSSRSRKERLAFFTRHWGEAFIPKLRVAPSLSLPNITPEHFKNYLATTGKKHRSYLKARRALLKTLARHDENKRVDADDIPKILLNPHFSLADPEIFEAIFLEPNLDQPDRLLVDCGKGHATTSYSVSRCDSIASLTPSFSEDARISTALEPFEAGKGRYFRRYAQLQNTLEYFHDLVDSRLNNQLVSKSNEFWKTVISYSSLYGELADARRKVARVRGSLKSVDEKVYKHMTRIMELSNAREQRKRLLQKLQDIACLRDAQPAVQMLLNQNDYPKALECIQTAQEVLCHDLRGVACFRHLNTQLQELYKVIGRMLEEEFIALIQKEFGHSCENESEAFYQEVTFKYFALFVHVIHAQLNPVVLGLLRVREYKFVLVLQHEIVETVKNILRQTVKSHVVKNLAADQITEFDPSLGSLSSQMRRLDFEQWCDALKHVFEVLYCTCKKVQSIQELILENIDHFQKLFMCDQSTASSPIKRYIVFCKAIWVYILFLVLCCVLRTDSNVTLQAHIGTDSMDNVASTVTSSKNGITGTSNENVGFGGDDDELEGDEQLNAASNLNRPPSSSLSSFERSISSETQSATINFSKSDKEQISSTTKVEEHLSASDGSKFASGATPSAILSVPCRDLTQVRQAISLLVEHAIYACQERCCRLLVARSKDGFLEKLSIADFSSVIQLVGAFLNRFCELTRESEKYLSPLRVCITQQCSAFIKRFHEDRKGKLGFEFSSFFLYFSYIFVQMEQQPLLLFNIIRTGMNNILDSENWRSTEIPEHFQELVNECCVTGRLHDIGNIATATNKKPLKSTLEVNGETFVVVGAALFLLQILAQYCDVVTALPDYASELLMYVVELLKGYNSRSCQLILGAGALQLIGLKSISVRHLALSSRCLQLILKFVPYVQLEFEKYLKDEKKSQLRYISKVVRDYNDHIQEITNKLISVIDHHVIAQLKTWELKGNIPTPTFQQICKQFNRFYNGLSGIMPEYMIKELFQQVHENFKVNLKNQLVIMGVTPHDSLTYGLASQEYLYYIKTLRSMPCCADWNDETISEALFSRN
uniref:Vacuolar protein sorting-associated protein 54 n=1 Tax=Syphacia muris TaxID=451379 RepID=A0A0N5AQS1_9BILA